MCRHQPVQSRDDGILRSQRVPWTRRDLKKGVTDSVTVLETHSLLSDLAIMETYATWSGVLCEVPVPLSLVVTSNRDHSNYYVQV